MRLERTALYAHENGFDIITSALGISRWMKQHLKIKSFWGTTMNAVRIQVYCAIITYCFVDNREQA